MQCTRHAPNRLVTLDLPHADQSLRATAAHQHRQALHKTTYASSSHLPGMQVLCRAFLSQSSTLSNKRLLMTEGSPLLKSCMPFDSPCCRGVYKGVLRGRGVRAASGKGKGLTQSTFEVGEAPVPAHSQGLPGGVSEGVEAVALHAAAHDAVPPHAHARCVRRVPEHLEAVAPLPRPVLRLLVPCPAGTSRHDYYLALYARSQHPPKPLNDGSLQRRPTTSVSSSSNIGGSTTG